VQAEKTENVRIRAKATRNFTLALLFTSISVNPAPQEITGNFR
jgi:hypothetical protein